jgi:hypothetical protein
MWFLTSSFRVGAVVPRPSGLPPPRPAPAELELISVVVEDADGTTVSGEQQEEEGRHATGCIGEK